MIKLTKSLEAWGSAEFEATLKNEIEQLNASLLPLQQGLSQSSYVSDSTFYVLILKTQEEADFIATKIGIQYSGIIAGSCCADDPTPINEISEYCEVLVKIDRRTAETAVQLL